MSSITTAVPPLAQEISKNLAFSIVDYFVLLIMLSISAGIGVYFGVFSKSKNTTEEYLMGGKKMKVIPIAISLVASQLSGIALMTIPAETYSFGFSYMMHILSLIVAIPIMNYVIVPIFFENKILNCYEYLQLRFNRRTRQFVTGTFLLYGFLMMPIVIFIPALAFSQVTGLNIQMINTVVCSICIFYTVLGGIKAVVWTDVIQAANMILSVFLVVILGTLKAGGFNQVLENSGKGERLNFSFSMDPRTRSTVWCLFSSGITFWLGLIGVNQSCVQRIVSLPSVVHAKRALVLCGIGVVTLLTCCSFTGIVMFSRYFGCDPVLAGIVEKADKILPFFVQDVMGHLVGMPGIFISCIFSAALSTLSAMMNSISGVIYFDYIKPHIRHTDAKANAIMKLTVFAMGIYCIIGGVMVQKFSSIIQTVTTIMGINTGAVVGVFMLGMFVPRVNGKVALISFGISIATMLWIIINAQIRLRTGVLHYDPLPTTLENCEAHHFGSLVRNMTTTQIHLTTDHPSISNLPENKPNFNLYDISFNVYQISGVLLVWLTAIPLSYIWKRNPEENIDPILFTPFARNFLPKVSIEMEPMNVKQLPHDYLNGDNTTKLQISKADRINYE